MINILLADDHTLIREGLKQILSDIEDISSIDEASTGEEVISLVDKNEYDLVLLDISLPGRSGIEILKQVKEMKPEQNILMLSMHPEEQYAVRCFKSGASGYVTKDTAPDELISAIQQVLAGQKYVSANLAQRLAAYIQVDSDKPLHEQLSDREYEVLRMIASGVGNKEIAEQLSLSAKTISTYRARILDKLNLKTNAELTYYAIQNDLIE